MRQRLIIGVALVLLLFAGALAMALWPLEPPEFAAVRTGFVPSDAFLLDRNGKVLDSVRVDFRVRRHEWQALDDISPALVSAVIEGEDRRFWNHQGIDWRSVTGSMRDRLLRNRNRGASTITMQVASLLQPSGRARRGWRAWSQKRNQARLARGLEARWSKQEILEAYFNLLHFRGELQGIGATAHVLAQKAPSGLSLAESLVIAALLPEPNAAAHRVASRACARARSSRSAIACGEIQRTAGTLLARGRDSSAARPLAPHLASTLLKAPGERVATTLDGETQRLAHEVLRRQLGELHARNVRDGAVLVVENRTGDVLAYVGSAGPQSRSAQVDGVRALRQAGSTLKPFLYELALERRYLTAASLLKDSPLHLDTATGAYIPQDYDKDFKGLVSVRAALGNSLNIPAVRTLVLVGVEPFRARLHDLGYADITESGEYYGYALALGSAEVTLWEQAQAYRALARGGQWSAIRVRADEEMGPEASLLSADASFIVADIMSDSAARALTFGMDNYLNTPFWSAAKTGTSKDMRDNWCIGFSSEFTVAVWVGNFEGDPMHEVSGVSGAAPVWHDLMVALHERTSSVAPKPPTGVVSAAAHFARVIEPQRREWFLQETSPGVDVTVTPAEGIARIASPANGMIIALDPDIPPAYQRVPIDIEGAGSDLRVKLNGETLMTSGSPFLWVPKQGAHRLALEDAQGRMLDQILFTVR